MSAPAIMEGGPRHGARLHLPDLRPIILVPDVIRPDGPGDVDPDAPVRVAKYRLTDEVRLVRRPQSLDYFPSLFAVPVTVEARVYVFAGWDQ